MRRSQHVIDEYRKRRKPRVGIQYNIWIRKGNKLVIYKEALLPGIVPEHVVPMLDALFADEMGLCEECNMACHMHPIDEHGGKWCTVLLHDAISPPWKCTEEDIP